MEPKGIESEDVWRVKIFLSLKNNKLLLATLFFFLLINTAYFWEWRSSLLSIALLLILLAGYILLSIAIIVQIFSAVEEKFKNRARIILITVMAIVLILTYCKPNGIIDFENWEGKILLVADREGAANCTTTLKLNSNNKISVRIVCFGISKISGDYTVKNDTIFFSNYSKGRHEFNYQFALIRKNETQNKKILGELLLFTDMTDKHPDNLLITKNELNK